jgi:exodeoxyribonuclease V beta subunit
MRSFDLLGPLPEPCSTTVLEASAGTGKTFTLAALVTRYVAEGVATLDQMLLITFSRAASQELRDRVRGQIVHSLRAFDDPALIGDNEVVRTLLAGTDADVSQRRTRLRDALAGFDAATIATTHQFCQLVLKSLGVAGDTDSRVTLVENLDDLVDEIVADVYLAHFGRERDHPRLTYRDAQSLAHAVVMNPAAQLRPTDPAAGTRAAVCLRFVKDVLRELDIRKRRRGILGYDDLLSRLADALEPSDSPARVRMRHRWPIVMVDEFQDTDPVQWAVIDRAFSGKSTVILIGDPKQAIYAFRGGDIVTYLQAAETAGDKQTLAINRRSDQALVERLQVVLGGAELGDPRIVVRDVQAHHPGSRLAGAPSNDPLRLRFVSRADLGCRRLQHPLIDDLRVHIGKDLAADISMLLASAATFDGRPVQPGDVAVIVETHKDARACFQALCDAGIPAVYTGDSDVFESAAAADWLTLLEAFDQPHRSGLVRAAAATVFLGHTAETLAAGGDRLTDETSEILREWAAHARERGVAAVFEAAKLRGMADRVLSWRGGQRLLTDLAHITELLQDHAHTAQCNLPTLRDWLRRQRDDRNGAPERNRRLDSDAAAVQIMTVWASKGLQYPIVYLPFAFNRYVSDRDLIVFHEQGVRCLHVGGAGSVGHAEAQAVGAAEAASDGCRLTYVAMTRAQSQVIAWWAPSHDEPNGGLSRLLRGRGPGEATVPDRCEPKTVSDDVVLAHFRQWEDAGGPVVEIVPARAVLADPPTDAALPEIGERHFHRHIDTGWRRTSYSALIRSDTMPTSGVSSEPEVAEVDDEISDGETPVVQSTEPVATRDMPSPMGELPTGAKIGSLVHAVLETADPSAPDLHEELRTHIDRHRVWWPIDVDTDDLAAALIPLHDTPLGPLAAGLTLRQIGLPDRLCELDFEMPLAGGDVPDLAVDIRLADVGRLLGEHLLPDDPMAPYHCRLTDPDLGTQQLRGYLSGSIDAVLRLPGGRYVVVDYKTNWLGEPGLPLTAANYAPARLAEAMLHSDYPLQALLYSVVLHRFLRWRLPDYEPERHLGGIMYLFVRGMCGPEVPITDGNPAGVFSWRPPAALIEELSELLDGRRVAG